MIIEATENVNLEMSLVHDANETVEKSPLLKRPRIYGVLAPKRHLKNPGHAEKMKRKNRMIAMDGVTETSV